MRSCNVLVNILVPHVAHVDLRRGKGDVRLANFAHKFRSRFFGLFRCRGVSKDGAMVVIEDGFAGKYLRTRGTR